MVEVAAGNPGKLGRDRYIAARLREESRDRLTLELADETVLAGDKPLAGRHAQRRRALDV
jgi:hypothetical protein